MPWSLVYYEAYIKEKFARMREKRLKYNGNAIRELKKRIGLLKSGAGFTLIELLITIVVVGLLAAGLITVFNPLTQLEKARDAGRKSDLSQIQRALEVYYNDNNDYPASLTFGAAWNPYMGFVPEDPRSGRNYVYSRIDVNTYRMYASLERGANDSQACTVIPCARAGTLSCGEACNYGATSPNTTP